MVALALVSFEETMVVVAVVVTRTEEAVDILVVLVEVGMEDVIMKPW